MDPGFDNLESSLKFEDSLLGQSGTIDTLCHTYLANMDSFPSSSASSPRGDYGAEGGYGASYRDDLKTFTSRNVRDWDGEVRRCVDLFNITSYALPVCPHCLRDTN